MGETAPAYEGFFKMQEEMLDMVCSWIWLDKIEIKQIPAIVTLQLVKQSQTLSLKEIVWFTSTAEIPHSCISAFWWRKRGDSI